MSCPAYSLDEGSTLPRGRGVRTRVVAVFRRLRQRPAVSGVKRLSGPLAGEYRVRTGDYRVQFRIEGDEVIVVKVGHRDGFYED
jgi:mRNA-degrading endonuclease RelE of RelBE toxin-antitoxin system